MPFSPAHAERLMERIRQRDASAVAEVYDGYAPSLYGIAIHLTSDTAAAEALLRDAFVGLWCKVPGHDRSKGGPFAYVLSIMMELAVAQGTIIDHAHLVHACAGSKDSFRLAPELRAIHEARYVKGWNEERTARELDMDPVLVRSRTHEVMHQLIHPDRP